MNIHSEYKKCPRCGSRMSWIDRGLDGVRRVILGRWKCPRCGIEREHDSGLGGAPY